MDADVAGGRSGTAAGQHQHLVHRAQRVHQPDEDGGDDGRSDHRQRDVPEDLPLVRAVDLGLLERVGRQRDQRRDQRQRHQRRPVPDIHDHRDHEGGPGRLADVEIDAEPAVQKAGDDADRGGGHQLPDRADDDRRHDQRQRMDGAEEGLAGKLLHEGLRQRIADHQFGQDGKEDEGHGHAQRGQEALVEHHAAEVVRSAEHHLGVGRERVPVVERDIEHIQERQNAEQEQDDQRRRQQQPCELLGIHGPTLCRRLRVSGPRIRPSVEGAAARTGGGGRGAYLR
uniref:Uncharacterized protein n=1 Tax=Cereibacter sphaeroides (strain ATCC 17025 / ATH 2.4.3) TaxID=349102 RepID=A4WYI8_CERS5